MCTNEPLTAIKEGLKQFLKISWKLAEIRRGWQPPRLVIRGSTVPMTDEIIAQYWQD
jgi:hypothetical protein